MASEEEVKRAYKAFKKRLKLARLDDASAMGMGGKLSKIAGITPPAGFPPEVWDELVAQKKLRREGSGTFSLAGEL